METVQDILRETTPQRPPASSNKRRPNPTRLFVDRDRLAWWWFICAGVVLVAAALDRYHLVNAFKQRERVVIIDPAGTFYVSPLLNFENANELHAQQSTLATIALLQRNPKDFDQAEMLKQMFLKSAHEKALALRSGVSLRLRGHARLSTHAAKQNAEIDRVHAGAASAQGWQPFALSIGHANWECYSA